MFKFIDDSSEAFTADSVIGILSNLMEKTKHGKLNSDQLDSIGRAGRKILTFCEIEAAVMKLTRTQITMALRELEQSQPETSGSISAHGAAACAELTRLVAANAITTVLQYDCSGEGPQSTMTGIECKTLFLINQIAKRICDTVQKDVYLLARNPSKVVRTVKSQFRMDHCGNKLMMSNKLIEDAPDKIVHEEMIALATAIITRSLDESASLQETDISEQSSCLVYYLNMQMTFKFQTALDQGHLTIGELIMVKAAIDAQAWRTMNGSHKPSLRTSLAVVNESDLEVAHPVLISSTPNSIPSEQIGASPSCASGRQRRGGKPDKNSVQPKQSRLSNQSQISDSTKTRNDCPTNGLCRHLEPSYRRLC